MEDRILAGSIQSARLPYEWPTDSIWTGNWDALGMSGSGLYLVPHGERHLIFIIVVIEDVIPVLL